MTYTEYAHTKISRDFKFKKAGDFNYYNLLFHIKKGDHRQDRYPH